MGMYTEFIIDAKLKENTPIEIIKCINNMVNDIEDKTFTYERNPLYNYCKSDPKAKSFKKLHLKAHGKIKNYWNDIDKFVNFITPHIEKGFLEGGAFSKSKYEVEDCWFFYYLLTKGF